MMRRAWQNALRTIVALTTARSAVGSQDTSRTTGMANPGYFIGIQFLGGAVSNRYDYGGVAGSETKKLFGSGYQGPVQSPPT